MLFCVSVDAKTAVLIYVHSHTVDYNIEKTQIWGVLCLFGLFTVTFHF